MKATCDDESWILIGQKVILVQLLLHYCFNSFLGNECNKLGPCFDSMTFSVTFMVEVSSVRVNFTLSGILRTEQFHFVVSQLNTCFFPLI